MSETEFEITQKEAAEYLRVSTKTISRYRKKGLPYKMMLNPVSGKQEVRFRKNDLERWSEGRQLLSTYGQEGHPAADKTRTEPEESLEPSRETARTSGSTDYLAELLEMYKEQIELLHEQLADMRKQLARRDRQIEDLMRMMVGLQLEYKPVEGGTGISREAQRPARSRMEEKRIFSEKELSSSVFRLRKRGKSYAEIARGLNQLNVATLSGNARWTEGEVQSLLPPVIDNEPNIIEL